MHAFVELTNEEKATQREMQLRIKEQEMETKRNLALNSQRILEKRREDVLNLNSEKKLLTKQLIKEQEKDLRLKQKKRNDVRKMEEEARFKREEEKKEQERRMREHFEAKAAAEEAEVRRAEKLVRALEKKEREWMQKLQEAQKVQEAAFEHLEYALVKDPSMDSRATGSPGDVSPAGSGSRGGGSGGGFPTVESFKSSGGSGERLFSGDKDKAKKISSSRPRGPSK